MADSSGGGDGGAAKRIRVEVEGGADDADVATVAVTEGVDDDDQVTATVIGELVLQ